MQKANLSNTHTHIASSTMLNIKKKKKNNNKIKNFNVPCFYNELKSMK